MASDVSNPLVKWKNPNFISRSRAAQKPNRNVAAKQRGKRNRLATPREYMGRLGGVSMRAYYGDGIPVIESVRKTIENGRGLADAILHETSDYSDYASRIAQAKRENKLDDKKKAQDELLKFCTERSIDPSKDEQVQALLAM